jgi:hypothetical protein
MSDRHVVPAEDGWLVEKDNARRPSAKTATQAEAVKRAVEIVANDGGGQVVVHGTNGQVRETRTVEAGAEDVGVEATRATVAASAAGFEASAKTISEDVRSALNAGQQAASVAATAGRDVRKQVSRSAQDVVREAQTTADNGLQVVEDSAERAGAAMRSEADRVAKTGRQLEHELDTAAARTARRVRTFTERVARPLDTSAEQVLDMLGRVTHTLNPVRVSGRAVELGTSATLRTAGALASRSGRSTRDH